MDPFGRREGDVADATPETYVGQASDPRSGCVEPPPDPSIRDRTGTLARMATHERFEELTAEAIDALPEWVRQRLDNVEVTIEDYPPPDQRNLLGLYHGIPLTQRGDGYTGVMPDRITLYRSTIEQVSGADPERLRETIAHTVRHEIAHYFGISDERLHELEAY